MARRLGPQGIYALISRVTNQIYVGSAKDVEVRRRKHLAEMKAGEHHNWKLQVDAKRHGLEQFVHVTLEIVDDGHTLFEREQWWMDALDVVATGYNIRPRAKGPRGVKRRPETIARMREAAKRRAPPTKETRMKMREAKLGGKLSAEQRAKMSASAKTRPPISEETRAKMAEARAQYWTNKRNGRK